MLQSIHNTMIVSKLEIRQSFIKFLIDNNFLRLTIYFLAKISPLHHWKVLASHKNKTCLSFLTYTPILACCLHRKQLNSAELAALSREACTGKILSCTGSLIILGEAWCFVCPFRVNPGQERWSFCIASVTSLWSVGVSSALPRWIMPFCSETVVILCS